MARFRYRLATLLRLREASRDEHGAQLATAHEARRLLDEQIDQINSELAETNQRQRDYARSGALEVDRLIGAHQHALMLHSRSREASRHEAMLAEEIERRRQTLVTADREVRVLERLREVHRARHRQEQMRAEAKEIDESVAQQFTRREENVWLA